MDDIDRFLQEDLGQKGDITSDALFSTHRARAVITAKEDCIVAGIEEAIKVFIKCKAKATPRVNDGELISKGTTVLQIEGPARSILKGERLALNMLSRMSGIATETKQIVDRCKKINPKIMIAATRKTTPGFRTFEKKAVILGGGEPHRYGLFDAVLIKDNHLKITGSVDHAIQKIKEKLKDTTIEIEVENEADALTAARMNVDVIMLDNLDPRTGARIARKIRDINPHILVEVSGGIHPGNAEMYASFADRISLGYLTHSIKNKDFSLEIVQ